MKVKVPHGSVVIVWKNTDVVAQPPYKPEDVDYGIGIDTDGDGVADYINWQTGLRAERDIEAIAKAKTAEYAAGVDSGQYRDYAEEDFYAGFMAAINYIKTQDNERE